jgi:adenine/guanine phosphoribosyltransferase-like PRPP-binding protein
VNFVSIWQKSLYGRTLTEIKADDDMVQFFADSIVPVIKEMLGYNLPNGDWAVVTTPKRRHLTKNFATRISEVIAQQLGIPFYEDVASCRSKQRMNAVFTLNVLPKEANLIVFDDFVTTGQTLASMRRLLEEHGKNLVFFTGINNKL